MMFNSEILLFIVIALLFVLTVARASSPYYSPDLDEDEFVDFNDFAGFAANWQQTGGGIDGDFDNNGIVDANDLWHFTEYWLTEVIYPPIAEDQNITLTEGQSIEIVMQGSDENNDSLDYFVVSYPAEGPLIEDGNRATYSPFAGYDGNDSFEFIAYDGEYESNIAKVSITVRPDSDDDGLSDYDEINGTYGYITDPYDPNTDGDTMPDGWEINNSLNPTVNDAVGNPDNDNFTNLQEYQADTNPQNPDTDADGLLDGAEAVYGCNPLCADTDGDGIKDGAEVSWGLEPDNSDTDGDGVNDNAEVSYNGNSNDYHPYPWAGHDWDECDLNANSDDTDSDGMKDKWEYDNAELDIVWTKALDPRYGSDAGNDTDSDGLINSIEHSLNLNSLVPDGADTDGDGLTDGQEYYGTITGYQTSASEIDTDGDFLIDGYNNKILAEDYPEGIHEYYGGSSSYVYGEVSIGSNPVNKHSDGDNMPDGWEVRQWNMYRNSHFDPIYNYPGVGGSDFDGDALTNLVESQKWSLARYSDTDSDGLSDGYEVNTTGTDPTNNDCDNDGLTDGYEVNNSNTDPEDYDSDDDLLSDKWEVDNSLNPNSSSGNDGKNGDPDGDGLVNLDEVIYGANPRNSDTDSDGTNDGAEVAQGSNPADNSDGGQAAEDKYADIKLTVGDHSGSNSERYNLKVGTITHQAPEFGVVEERVYPFEVGKKYEITIIHQGSNLDEPDYDYTALVEANEPANGWMLILEDPDGILGVHNESDYFYAQGKKAYLYLVKPDLKIYNGCGGSEVAEGDETDVGAYVLVNWDDDNDNDQPDVYESGQVSGEGDLAKIELTVLPDDLDKGTVALVKAGGTGSNIKVWDSESRQNEVTELSWDIADMPDELWLEARAASNSERNISLQFKYSYGGSAADEVKATAVMVNLGNAVYRELDLFGIGSLKVGHAALVYEYTGNCNPADFDDADNYWIIEMDGPTNDKPLSTMTDVPGLPPMGCYTTQGMTYRKRLEVIKTAEEMVTRANVIQYSLFGVLLPQNWDDTVDGITHLRCDGLVEACYEMNGLNAWGKLVSYPANYDVRVDSFQAEHNEQLPLPDVWKRYLAPATQCGRVDYGYEGVYWDSALSPQNLCEPVGNTGGWE
ncbi:MAG: hypothetical protein JW804_02930 [Sedimentisphaerales bacterium]|nr:hypothetical protein [Sedimentisphaerales bacterium]